MTPPAAGTGRDRPDPGKAAHAFRSIGEVSEATGVPQHVLRYWEGKFPQLRPVTRAGGRRHYRPEDVALVSRIDALLRIHGYTIRGVQKLLAGERADAPQAPRDAIAALRPIRDALVAALAADEV